MVSLQVLEPANCCPHVRRVGEGYECGVIHPTSAREVCDQVSLERWCLHPERHVECLFYRKALTEKRKLVF